MTATLSSPQSELLSPASPSSRTPRQEHQALVFIERAAAGRAADALPRGWSWTLGNSSVAQLLACALAEADAGWAATLAPQELAPSLTPVHAATGSSLIPYNGRLRISPADVALPKEGEPVCIILNGHLFPFCSIAEALLLHRESRADATFFELRHSRPSRAYDERLRVTPDGRVEKVDRLYNPGPDSAPDAAPWPALVIVSRSCLQAMTASSLPQRMVEWPAAFLRWGKRVNAAHLPGRCFSLADEDALHELADTILRLRPEWLWAEGNLHEHAPRVWVGKNVTLPASAQVIGPVAIGDDVEVGEHAIIVGPAAIGRRSRIGARVVVRRAVVGAGSSVVTDCRRAKIASGDLALSSSPAPERLIRLQTVLEAHRTVPLAPLRHGAYAAVKRAMDIVGALIFLCITLPFYPLVALAIKINSSGPIFYGHTRQGLFGREFRCWKFRTMIANAEQLKHRLLARNEVDGPQFKMKDDPRIFFVGRWLRRLNIDEWPQAWNVLLGQMSLVGPRPSPESENQLCPAWREARLSVRPGITGLWQVSRQRGGETDFQEWIYYDVQYVKRQSLALDLMILFKTLRVALRGS